jgi:hypothetical protein
MEFEVLTSVVMKCTIIWDITPCSPLKAPAFTLVSCLAYSSTLKMEAICFSETSVDFQRNTQRYIPEDSTFREIIDSKIDRGTLTATKGIFYGQVIS